MISFEKKPAMRLKHQAVKTHPSMENPKQLSLIGAFCKRPDASPRTLRARAADVNRQVVTGVVQPRAGVGPVGKEANMDHIQRVAT